MTSLGKNIDSITVVRGLKAFLTETEAKVQYGILSGKVDTLITLPLSFNVAFATALVPTIASAKATNNMENANKRVKFSLMVTMILGLPCTFGMFIFAEPILQLLFPNAASGAFLLQISALTIIFAVLMQTVNGALQGLGRVMVPAIASAIGLIVKFILNIVLISNPKIGVNGAAIASVVNVFIAFVISFYILMKSMKIDLKVSNFIVKPIIATIIMCIISYFIYNILLGILPGKIVTLIALISAVIIYAILIVILKIFTKEEMCMIPYGNKLVKILEKLGIYAD